jgi:hypothetical protein
VLGVAHDVNDASIVFVQPTARNCTQESLKKRLEDCKIRIESQTCTRIHKYIIVGAGGIIGAIIGAGVGGGGCGCS